MSTETLTAPVETVTPIGPREALRLGRLVLPVRTPGRYFVGWDGACAVGAIAVGWGEPIDIIPTFDRLADAGVHTGTLMQVFDDTERCGEDGDAAVDAYLAGLGL